MNNLKIDYNRVFEDTVKNLSAKKRLLLHACCAPCSGAVLERVTPFFDVTVFFFNPNIDTEKEYYKRAEELDKLNNRFNISSIIVPKYAPNLYLEAIKGQENLKEGDARCKTCFILRLKEAAKMCEVLNTDFFATTLTVSPHKNSTLINTIGESMSTKSAVYLPSDFKKKDGYKRSLIISGELDFYRQSYCACSYSKQENELRVAKNDSLQ